MRSPAIHHCTSLPHRFFGRSSELASLDDALAGGPTSVAAFVGPGGQGKTAIVQHWLRSRAAAIATVDGVFLWSFYRGKDSDLCLRHLFAYAEGLPQPPEASASFCVDRLLPRLRSERWAIVFDGAEVVQHESGAWRGRFIHPELGRLIETLAEEAMPGVVAITTRFELPTLTTRRHARLFSLQALDGETGIQLLTSLGVHGSATALEAAVDAAGGHAKAVELLATWLTRFHRGDAEAITALPRLVEGPTAESAEERSVNRVLSAFHADLPTEAKDLLALSNAFHQPPTEDCLTRYLRSEPVRQLVHEGWHRTYPPFVDRSADWLPARIQELVDLRLLERVGLMNDRVLDAHPLVRRGFENALGEAGADAKARAGFLRGRPDRAKPASLAEAREEVELFHAYVKAGLWNEADGALIGLDNPKHRFLAPAFERDLLTAFFPAGDFRQPPLWPGFGRYRSLAICHEMLGQFEEALEIYRPEDAPLRGDALIALGRLDPLLRQTHVPHPWQSLWQAYRSHALALAGQTDAALSLARSAIPLDIYEWVHVFEALYRLDRLDLIDLRSLRSSVATDESRWSLLARRRIEADFAARVDPTAALTSEYRALIEEYDRAGLAFERTLTRIRFARHLSNSSEAVANLRAARDIARQYRMPLLEAEAAERSLGGWP